MEKTAYKAHPKGPASPHLTAPHALELTGSPGRPGPSPSATRPGSPCRTEGAAESWVQFWAQEACRGGGEPLEVLCYSLRGLREPTSSPSTYRLPLWASRSLLSLRTKQGKG